MQTRLIETEKLITGQSKSNALDQKKSSERALKNIINSIHKYISQLELEIEEEIETKFQNTLKEIKDLEDKISSQIAFISSVNEKNLLEKVRPIQNGSIPRPLTRRKAQTSLNITDKNLVSSIQAIFNKIYFTLDRFKSND